MILDEEATRLAKDIIKKLKEDISDNDLKSYSFVLGMIAFYFAEDIAVLKGRNGAWEWYAKLYEVFTAVGKFVHGKSDCRCGEEGYDEFGRRIQ